VGTDHGTLRFYPVVDTERVTTKTSLLIVLASVLVLLDGTSSLEGINSENLLLKLTRLLTVRPIVMLVFQVCRKGVPVKTYHSYGSRAVRKPVVELAFTQAGIGRTYGCSSVNCRHRRIAGRGDSV
jgi:hypothetical protein